jgi:hypothetical protein
MDAGSSLPKKFSRSNVSKRIHTRVNEPDRLGSHGENTGSSPVGVTSNFKHLRDIFSLQSATSLKFPKNAPPDRAGLCWTERARTALVDFRTERPELARLSHCDMD